MGQPFAKHYPNLTTFIENYGWIELGYNPHTPCESIILVLSEGDVIWEGEGDFANLDEILQMADRMVVDWMMEMEFEF